MDRGHPSQDAQETCAGAAAWAPAETFATGKRTIANDEVLEIVTSVFPAVESDPFLDQPEVCSAFGDAELINQPQTFDDRPPTTLEEFAAIVQAVEQAIEHDVHPRRNAKGSSGSYLARDESGEIVGVFKPKDEEPYGRLNPKVRHSRRNDVAHLSSGPSGRIGRSSARSSASAAHA